MSVWVSWRHSFVATLPTSNYDYPPILPGLAFPARDSVGPPLAIGHFTGKKLTLGVVILILPVENSRPAMLDMSSQNVRPASQRYCRVDGSRQADEPSRHDSFHRFRMDDYVDTVQVFLPAESDQDRWKSFPALRGMVHLLLFRGKRTNLIIPAFSLHSKLMHALRRQRTAGFPLR